MNKLKLFIASMVVAAGLIAVSAPAHATQNCDVQPAVKGTSLLDLKNMSIVQNGKMLNISVTVTGDADCQKSVSVATWKWYNDSGLPLESQKLYKTATATFGVGTHTISVEAPACRWQADLLEGTRATAADGTANYQLGAPTETTDRLMDFAFSSNLAICNDDTVQTPVPPVITPVVTQLPSTGIANVLLNTVILSALTGLGYSFIQSRKLSK